MERQFNERGFPVYCARPNFTGKDCFECALSNYGRDCENQKIERREKSEIMEVQQVERQFNERGFPVYCARPNFTGKDCFECALSNYGRDCENQKIERREKSEG